MADLDIKQFTVVERSIRVEFTRQQVEQILAEYVREESSLRLKDFAMRCEIMLEPTCDAEEPDDRREWGWEWSCVVTGTSRKQKEE